MACDRTLVLLCEYLLEINVDSVHYTFEERLVFIFVCLEVYRGHFLHLWAECGAGKVLSGLTKIRILVTIFGCYGIVWVGGTNWFKSGMNTFDGWQLVWLIPFSPKKLATARIYDELVSSSFS